MSKLNDSNQSSLKADSVDGSCSSELRDLCEGTELPEGKTFHQDEDKQEKLANVNNESDRPYSPPLEEIPYVKEFLGETLAAYEFAKNYHPNISKTAKFIEEKSTITYNKFSKTEIGKDKILPVLAKIYISSLLFLSSAINNSEQLKTGSKQQISAKNDGKLAVFKAFLLAIYVQAQNDITKTEIYKNSSEKFSEQIEIISEKVGQHVDVEKLKERVDVVKRNCYSSVDKMNEAREGCVEFIRERVGQVEAAH